MFSLDLLLEIARPFIQVIASLGNDDLDFAGVMQPEDRQRLHRASLQLRSSMSRIDASVSPGTVVASQGIVQVAYLLLVRVSDLIVELAFGQSV